MFIVFSETSNQLKTFWQQYQRVAAIDAPNIKDTFGVEVDNQMYRAQYVYEVNMVKFINPKLEFPIGWSFLFSKSYL